ADLVLQTWCSRVDFLLSATPGPGSGEGGAWAGCHERGLLNVPAPLVIDVARRGDWGRPGLGGLCPLGGAVEVAEDNAVEMAQVGPRLAGQGTDGRAAGEPIVIFGGVGGVVQRIETAARGGAVRTRGFANHDEFGRIADVALEVVLVYAKT